MGYFQLAMHKSPFQAEPAPRPDPVVVVAESGP